MSCVQLMVGAFSRIADVNKDAEKVLIDLCLQASKGGNLSSAAIASTIKACSERPGNNFGLTSTLVSKKDSTNLRAILLANVVDTQLPILEKAFAQLAGH